MLIPFVGWMVALGWALKVSKNMINEADEIMPELDFGEDILRGFFSFLIIFIYCLPASPISTLTGWMGNWYWFTGETGLVVASLFGSIFSIFAFLLSIVAFFLSLGGIANFLLKNDFGAAFRLGEVFKLLKSNLGDWVIVVLGTFLAVGLIGPLGEVAYVIGVVLTMTYGLMVTSHLLGQAVVRSQGEKYLLPA